MRLRDRVKQWARRALTLQDPAFRGLFSDWTTQAGVTVSESTALRFAAVWACVRVISEDVATIPLFLYRRLPEGGKERADDRRLYRLLHDEPNPEMSSTTFRETLQAHILTWGNAYAEIQRNGNNDPIALWPLQPHRVTPTRAQYDLTGDLIYRVNRLNGRDVILTPNEVLHIPGLGYDGLMGYSPIRFHAQAIGLGLAAEEFGARFFGQGLNIGGFFEHPGTLSEPAYERLKKSIQEEYGTLGRSHLAMVLEENMKFQHLAIPPDEAQFIETRKMQVTEIARIFRVPPHVIQDLERATYSNIEEQAIDYVVSTLRPWLVRWEQEINRKLIPSLERGKFFAEHLIDGLLRGDAKGRATALQTQFQNGALSADEWREIENRNPLPDELGKLYFIQGNMQTIEQAKKAPMASPQSPMPVLTATNGQAQDGQVDVTQARDLVRTMLAEVREELMTEVRALRAVIVTPSPITVAQTATSTTVEVEHQAYRHLFLDAVQRVVRREGKAIRKRLQRLPTRETFLAWAKETYADQVPTDIVKYLWPTVAAYATAMNDARDVTALTELLASAYGHRLYRDLVDVAERATPESYVQELEQWSATWEQDGERIIDEFVETLAPVEQP